VDICPGPDTALARAQLAIAGGLLVVGGACTVAALSLPPLWSIVTAGVTEEVRLIGQHRGVWQLGIWLWAASAGLTLPGMIMLASAVTGSAGVMRGRLAPAIAASGAGVGLFVAGSVLWLSNLAFGGSVAVSVATSVRGGGVIPEWFQPVQQWASTLWQAGAPLLGLSLIFYGLVIRGGTILPGWAGWLAIAAGGLILAIFAPLGGAPPFLIYLLGTLPLGVAAIFRSNASHRRGDAGLGGADQPRASGMTNPDS
jgi:hypothetical protein